ncbi:hypothetical protein [Hydrogenophaga sp. MI9]|uniref:hypothetical protein n=1 Tax=Hydrogenophaga sp. MI9 TaxID=3453719 RepID=UPI003EED5703
MDVLTVVRSSRRPLAAAGIVAVVAALAGCYVVPIDPRTGQAVPTQTPVALPAPAAPLVFTARLYPANDLASGFGVVHASVTNDLQGRGTFNTVIGGESFSGEATRKAGSSREGLANGAGNRGGYITCAYTMNSATMGSGTCRLSSGALFSMHVGS